MSDLTGRVLYPGDPGWEESRRSFNSRIDYAAVEPKAVVFCQDTRDVVNAVRWARANGWPIRARGGRHSYEGYAQVKDGLIIDVIEIDTVRISPDRGRAVVGGGLHLLELYEKLWEVGTAVPGATCPQSVPSSL